ncbi:MAG TPA: SRPBCC domain-containing protein [Vicinamibacteria bacterium]|jgi:uncharacterized protein YndB with AHSA1/START domain
MSLPPVRRAVRVAWKPEEAFRRFTSGIAGWWPLRSHSVCGDRAEAVVFEERVGGRIYERSRSGEESTWGTVTLWAPPHRVAFTWHPGRDPAKPSAIEVSFSPDGAGSRLELVHTGWESFGPIAAKARRGYALGWGYVLRIWAGRTSSPVVLAMDALFWVLSPLQRRARRKAEAVETA